MTSQNPRLPVYLEHPCGYPSGKSWTILPSSNLIPWTISDENDGTTRAGGAYLPTYLKLHAGYSAQYCRTLWKIAGHKYANLPYCIPYATLYVTHVHNMHRHALVFAGQTCHVAERWQILQDCPAQCGTVGKYARYIISYHTLLSQYG